MLLIEKGANDWNTGLEIACGIGNIEIINLMISKGANDWNCGLREVCNVINDGITIQAHLDIIIYMLKLGANDYNIVYNTCVIHDIPIWKILRYCSDSTTKHLIEGFMPLGLSLWHVSYGSTNLIKLCLKMGVKGDGLTDACIQGRMDVVELMLEAGATNLNEGMYEACVEGHINIVKLLLNAEADDYNGGLGEACIGGYTDIMRLMIRRGATYDSRLMYLACCHRHYNIVDMLINGTLDSGWTPRIGIDEWNNGLCGACECGDVYLTRLMIQKDADALDRALDIAYENCRVVIIEIIVNEMMQKDLPTETHIS